nr:DUF5682 family protein [uncultured Porphyromonas sp.]
MATYILGVRHHGPGSARRVRERLEALRPDLILVEGPPEAEELLGQVAREGMKPPVALLAYEPTNPQNAVFYPFAAFSPEWQAMLYAATQGTELHFFDLPLIYRLAQTEVKAEETSEASPSEAPTDEATEELSTPPTEQTESSTSATDEESLVEVSAALPPDEEELEDAFTSPDPFDVLAEIDGLSDGEAWWNLRIESSPDGAEVFEAVSEAMTALREAFPERTSEHDLVREAWMRKQIREAERAGDRVIVVICGAWHAPALEARAKIKVKEDNERLKGLPKTKITCTWIPWTYDRLSLYSGYGAGITSPGWYDYLWHHPEDDGTLWVSRMAKHLRRKNMDISVAHVIETVRLAHATAALKEYPRALLEDYSQAAITVMGFGDPILLDLIKEELVIGNRLGSVPDDVPKVPLLVDIERQQKRLRLPFTSEIKTVTLDLRKPLDLEKSIFIHRLDLLGIGWGTERGVSGKGTFKEQWELYHKPEQIISIIERAVWGNTLQQATEAYMSHQAMEAQSIRRLAELLDEAIPADLSGLVTMMTKRLDELSASAVDVGEMLDTIPKLIRILRYGSVRALDFSHLEGILRVMVARSVAGGLQACSGIDETAADDLYNSLREVDQALMTLADEELRELWLAFLEELRTSSQVHPLLAGMATLLLNQADRLSSEQIAHSLSYHSSVGMKPLDMAYWLEGFLRSSSTLLLLEDRLWELVNDWICGITAENFHELLPVLRRTFSEYSPAERRNLGEKARHYDGKRSSTQSVGMSTEPLDHAEAARVLPLLHLFLGLD